jgi:putative endonuclease
VRLEAIGRRAQVISPVIGASTDDRKWSVYVLRCGDGTLYTGATNDLDRRLEAHQRGKGAAYTRSRRPVRLVYSEAAGDRSTALRREAQLKRLTRPEKLALIRRC